MKFFVLFVIALIFNNDVFATVPIRLKKGMIIKESVIISRETYHLNADTSLLQPLIIIEGSNITIDFNQATLYGSNDKKQPNEFYGMAINIKKGSKNITLKNANIHGFKIAVMGDSVDHLIINNCNLSYNYRQKLRSNLKREDISDWMSFHHNENDEWLRYGSGIYLKNCNKAIVKNNIITGGQCGLMMVRCNYSEIYNNNFSFNSAIGIGLYRSSK